VTRTRPKLFTRGAWDARTEHRGAGESSWRARRADVRATQPRSRTCREAARGRHRGACARSAAYTWGLSARSGAFQRRSTSTRSSRAGRWLRAGSLGGARRRRPEKASRPSRGFRAAGLRHATRGCTDQTTDDRGAKDRDWRTDGGTSRIRVAERDTGMGEGDRECATTRSSGSAVSFAAAHRGRGRAAPPAHVGRGDEIENGDATSLKLDWRAAPPRCASDGDPTAVVRVWGSGWSWP